MQSEPTARPKNNGLCECGCGQRTTRMRYANRTQGAYEAGDYRRFVPGHNVQKAERYTVDDNGCWIWLGPLNPHGYGAVTRNKRRMGAHVWFWERENGPVPDGLELDHVKERGCKSRACVNPAHLEPVTRTVNARRGAKTKLTENAVREIHSRLAAGESHRALGRAFGVTHAAIYDIARGATWKELHPAGRVRVATGSSCWRILGMG